MEVMMIGHRWMRRIGAILLALAIATGPWLATDVTAQGSKPARSVVIRIGSIPHVESWADALLVKRILETVYPYIKIDLFGFPSGNPSVAGLLSGQLDAAVIVGEQPAINGIAAKAPFKI